MNLYAHSLVDIAILFCYRWSFPLLKYKCICTYLYVLACTNHFECTLRKLNVFICMNQLKKLINLFVCTRLFILMCFCAYLYALAWSSIRLQTIFHILQMFVILLFIGQFQHESGFPLNLQSSTMLLLQNLKFTWLIWMNIS